MSYFVAAGVGIGFVETAEAAAVASMTDESVRGSAFGLLAGLQSLWEPRRGRGRPVDRAVPDDGVPVALGVDVGRKASRSSPRERVGTRLSPRSIPMSGSCLGKASPMPTSLTPC